ncbi:MAG: ParB/RepB/Spo0J family partition protein [Phycisphaeraceae bacterium]|nr:ParB/RepB/Spo0J family partition protein [Phycisphaeraceae bacterium]
MQTPAGRGRRLGRGLSSLIGTPIEVPITPPVTSAPGPAVPASSGGVGADGADTRPAQEPAQSEPAGQRVVYISLADIAPGRYQPRKNFDPVALGQLAASLKTAGVVQPIVVRLNPDGAPAYELVAGERRWRAAAIAGLGVIPAIVAAISEEQTAEWSLIENLQRADLSVMERAYAMKTLCERFGLTHGDVAERLGLDRSSVTNLLRLLELPPRVRELIENGALNAGHGKALAALPEEAQLRLAALAVQEEFSVRRLEEEVGRELRANRDGAIVAAGAEATPRADARADESALHTRAIVADLEKQLGEHLGTKVRIRTDRKGKSGTIEIRFFDLDHFDGIVAMTGFAMK